MGFYGIYLLVNLYKKRTEKIHHVSWQNSRHFYGNFGSNQIIFQPCQAGAWALVHFVDTFQGWNLNIDPCFCIDRMSQLWLPKLTTDLHNCTDWIWLDVDELINRDLLNAPGPLPAQNNCRGCFQPQVTDFVHGAAGVTRAKVRGIEQLWAAR